MKYDTVRSSLSLAVLTAALLGCPEILARDAAPDPAGLIRLGAQDDETEKLKSYSFAQRAEFTAAIREATAKLDVQIAALPPAAGDSPHGKAQAELKSARTILEERIGKVDQATPANWVSVRDEVLTALSQVQTAHERATKA